jgi:hypothetical protein
VSFLLDSDLCSAYLRWPGSLFARFMQHSGRLWMVTHNTADFRNIPGLRLDDWLAP